MSSKSLKDEIKKLRDELKEVKAKRRAPKRKAPVKRRAPARQAISVRQTVRVGGVPSAAPLVFPTPGAASQPIQIPPPISTFDRVADRISQNLIRSGLTAFENRPRQLPEVQIRPRPAQGIAQGEAVETLIPQMTPIAGAGVVPAPRRQIDITPARRRAQPLSPLEQTKTDEVNSNKILVKMMNDKLNELDGELQASKPGTLQREVLNEQFTNITRDLTRQKDKLNDSMNDPVFRTLQFTPPAPDTISDNSEGIALQRRPGLNTAPPRDNPVTEVSRTADLQRRIAEALASGEARMERLREKMNPSDN